MNEVALANEYDMFVVATNGKDTTDDDEVVQVDHDNKSACRDLTSIFLSRKWKKIAYLGNDKGQVVNANRFAGYVQAFEDVGEKLDCILCQDDSVCNIVLRELRSQNAGISEDMRVASCHNSEVPDSYLVSITSLKFGIVELGREACRVLVDLLAGRKVPQKTLLDYEVVVKESTK